MTRQRGAPEIAVLGNLTIDEITKDGGAIGTFPGGSALYVAATAAKLGANVHVFSNIGPDYPRRALDWLRLQGLDLTGVKKSPTNTTRFRISYRKGSRRLKILHPGKLLILPRRRTHWEAVHLGAVFGEISLSLISSVRRQTSFLSIDLQGFLRKKTGNNQVQLRPRRFSNLFQSFDLVKASASEARAQTSTDGTLSATRRLQRLGPQHLIITMGSKGSLLAERDGRIFRIPAYGESETVDPTGAGDAVVGGWLATFLSTKDPVWSASVGSALGSLIVRKKSLSKFRISRNELFRRAAHVYNKTTLLEN